MAEAPRENPEEKNKEPEYRDSSSDSDSDDERKERKTDREETKAFREALIAVLQDQKVAFNRMCDGMEKMETKQQEMIESIRSLNAGLKTCLAEVRSLGVQREEVEAQSTSNTEKPRAQLAQRTGGKDSEKKYKDVKCYRCNETGH
ncbi:uncharacterized protein LOC116417828 [Nasonia vitripennis]|uniref:Uncharacterized protein n=1 Tax=Nasonia vitripennis TaxID=7425 RepID=A0A7M7TB97_NASVI|nr:uncharacterized protein LOC116417828 [Nasonia vitripennis]XP_032457024.1 uncharacterized protein LOC116417828 [Nasonia vitripennis]